MLPLTSHDYYKEESLFPKFLNFKVGLSNSYNDTPKLIFGFKFKLVYNEHIGILVTPNISLIMHTTLTLMNF